MIKIRPAGSADVPAIVDLLEELDTFYGVTDFPPVTTRTEEISKLIFGGDHPVAHVLVAADGVVLAGLASYSYLWPAVGTTASLYLKELYVRAAHRRRGIARTLMAELVHIARDTGCSRVEWTTDRDSPEAQAFYKRLGVQPNDDKIMYRAEGDSLVALTDAAERRRAI